MTTETSTTDPTESSTSKRIELLTTVTASCGHPHRLLTFVLSFWRARGPCDHCWRHIREEKERAEHLRILQR